MQQIKKRSQKNKMQWTVVG